jgi:hypothetical protein
VARQCPQSVDQGDRVFDVAGTASRLHAASWATGPGVGGARHLKGVYSILQGAVLNTGEKVKARTSRTIEGGEPNACRTVVT